VLALVRVGATEVVVLVGADDVVDDAEGTEPLGPVRYQLAEGSPRHSPTVTARYPAENKDVRM
jgi:hypothetical protein